MDFLRKTEVWREAQKCSIRTLFYNMTGAGILDGDRLI